MEINKKTNKSNNLEEDLEDNLDDVENKPPDYYEVVPFNDFSNYPNINISININTNDKESLANINKSDLNNINKISNNITNSKIKYDIIKNNVSKSDNIIVNKQFILEKEEIYENNNLIIEEELKTLFYDYESVNNSLKFIYNQYEYIMSNINLNNKIKKDSLIELLKSYNIVWEEKLNEFINKEVSINCIKILKNEIVSNLKLRYEIIVNYIYEVRKIEKN